MRDIEAIIKDINEYAPVNDEWGSLDELIDEAFSTNDRAVIKPLFGLLERNQDHDGYGVFWSIVHALEALDNYQTELVASVLSKPHEISVIMLNRILNSGVQVIDDRSILTILEEIASNAEFPSSIRGDANGFAVYQRKNM